MAMTTDRVRTAVVQAAPVLFDRNATVAKARRLIGGACREAGVWTGIEVIERDRCRFRHRALFVICEICGLNRRNRP